jgi:hypothetical protein
MGRTAARTSRAVLSCRAAMPWVTLTRRKFRSTAWRSLSRPASCWIGMLRDAWRVSAGSREKRRRGAASARADASDSIG